MSEYYTSDTDEEELHLNRDDRVDFETFEAEKVVTQLLSSLAANRHSDIDKSKVNNEQDVVKFISDVTLNDDNYSNSDADSKELSETGKIREEALQICSLLPRFDYDFIYRMLYKNRHAENRVDLVLWDLIPHERPKAKWQSKHKNAAVDNGSSNNSESSRRNKNCTLAGDERKGKNEFMSKSTNNSTSQKGSLLNNYLQYMRYMKQNKWMKFSGRGQYYNTRTRNNIRRNFLTTGSANFVNKNRVREVLNIDEGCDVNRGNDFDGIKNTYTYVKLSDTTSGGPTMPTAKLKDVQQIELSSETSEDLHSEPSEMDKALDKLQHDIAKRDVTPSFQPSEINDYITHGEKLQIIQKNVDRGSQNEVNDDIDNRYAYLLGIFPTADPAYLKKVILRLPEDPEAVTQFIQTQWKNPTYLTNEEKKERIKITQQQHRYTVAFDVKQFLEVFPDPFKQFENPGRKCTHNPDAIEFLKSHFTLFKSTTLTRVYLKHNHNLCFTAQELATTFPDRGSVREDCLWEKNPSNDIPLLQECAFIKHKNEIREYLDKLIENEAKEFKKLKQRNELLECQCCYNNECMPSKCSTCRDGHIFCNSCIIKGAELKLAQGETRVTCFIDCDDEFSLSTLQNILTPTQFSILIRKKQEVEVMAAGLDDLVSCPFCHFASIPPPDDKVFKCFNPECMKESCRLCKELNHVPLKCNEKSEDARLFLEEKMTEAYVRKCSRCLRPYVKESGCNRISCVCGASMCYLCDKQIQGYEHFDRGNCSLHSNDMEINERTVQAVAKKTMEFIQAKDPKIKIDTRKHLKPLSLGGDYFAHNSTVLGRVNKVADFSTYKYA